MTEAFVYCLAVAARRTGVQVMFSAVMSNHHHTGVVDPEGRLPEFLEYLHKFTAKCGNALRGRWEAFWSSEQTSCVQLVGPEDVPPHGQSSASASLRAGRRRVCTSAKLIFS
jgi:putative transposase